MNLTGLTLKWYPLLSIVGMEIGNTKLVKTLSWQPYKMFQNIIKDISQIVMHTNLYIKSHENTSYCQYSKRENLSQAELLPLPQAEKLILKETQTLKAY